MLHSQATCVACVAGEIPGGGTRYIPGCGGAARPLIP